MNGDVKTTMIVVVIFAFMDNVLAAQMVVLAVIMTLVTPVFVPMAFATVYTWMMYAQVATNVAALIVQMVSVVIILRKHYE